MTAIKKSPLGKGLESLLPESFEGMKKDFFQCAIEEIQKNPFQPRREFDPSALAELSESIREHGIIQPLIVRNNGNGEGYLLVAGERRLRAAIQVGLKKVPVVVRNSTDNQKLLEEALIENIQREDLTRLMKRWHTGDSWMNSPSPRKLLQKKLGKTGHQSLIPSDYYSFPSIFWRILGVVYSAQATHACCWVFSTVPLT